MGYAACQDAEHPHPVSGILGGGTGASVGKIYGRDKATKTGLGMYAVSIGNLKIAAVVILNAFGDVFNPATGEKIAGPRKPDGSGFFDTLEELYKFSQRTDQFQHDPNSKANTTIGLPGTFSCRLQPNDTRDDVQSIVAQIYEGLSFGAGDAVIGVNPVTDDVENLSRVLDTVYGVIDKFNIPTQGCVLAHVTTQIEAIRRGAPGGLIFQSICGSEKGLKEFGVELAMLDEARAVGAEFNRIAGENCLYFETGQGSALSAGANFGADQVTMEARNYGLARHYDPFLVNTVVGFIGPEYLYNDRQIIRAGLEDHFMGKLSGISMGCDCCYTNHADADQNLNENLMILLATAGCNYIMGMPLGDDIMLNYQTTGFHETAALRELYGLTAIPPFQAWLEKMGFVEDGKLTELAGDASVLLA